MHQPHSFFLTLLQPPFSRSQGLVGVHGGAPLVFDVFALMFAISTHIWQHPIWDLRFECIWENVFTFCRFYWLGTTPIDGVFCFYTIAAFFIQLKLLNLSFDVEITFGEFEVRVFDFVFVIQFWRTCVLHFPCLAKLFVLIPWRNWIETMRLMFCSVLQFLFSLHLIQFCSFEWNRNLLCLIMGPCFPQFQNACHA